MSSLCTVRGDKVPESRYFKPQEGSNLSKKSFRPEELSWSSETLSILLQVHVPCILEKLGLGAIVVYKGPYNVYFEAWHLMALSSPNICKNFDDIWS